jgi:hypothetical protein
MNIAFLQKEFGRMARTDCQRIGNDLSAVSSGNLPVVPPTPSWACPWRALGKMQSACQQVGKGPATTGGDHGKLAVFCRKTGFLGATHGPSQKSALPSKLAAMSMT